MFHLSSQCMKSFFHQTCKKSTFNSLGLRRISITIPVLNDKHDDLKIRDDPVVAKLDSSQFKSIFNANLVDFFDMFKKYDYELRIVGGAVRDLLINKRPSDLDFATTATPSQMIEMFHVESMRTSSTVGISHGTVVVQMSNQEKVQVTTLRIDENTDGRHAKVAFTKNWILDARRRDFTSNAMYLDANGIVYDWLYGYDELMKRRVVFIGDANIRIPEDYLRILRYFRFYGRIAEKPDNHDNATIAAITQHIAGLESISGPRIWGELQKILTANFAIEILHKMFDCEMSAHIGLPQSVANDELSRLGRLTMGSFKNIAFHPVTILASQLHEPNDAINLQSRLKMQAFDRDLSMFLTENKQKYQDIDELLPYQKLLISSTGKANAIKEYVLELLKYNGKRELYDKMLTLQIPRMPVTSKHLFEKGVPPKTDIPALLDKLKQIWCERNFEITTEQLLNQLPKVLSELEQEKIKSSTNRFHKKRKY